MFRLVRQPMSQVRQSTFTPCIPARVTVLDQDDAPEEDAAGVARDGVVLDSHRSFATYSTLNKVIQRKSAKSDHFSYRQKSVDLYHILIL